MAIYYGVMIAENPLIQRAFILSRSKPLYSMVGDRRIELLTSSVSRKRSTSELTTLRQNAEYHIRICGFVKSHTCPFSKIKVYSCETDKYHVRAWKPIYCKGLQHKNTTTNFNNYILRDED